MATTYDVDPLFAIFHRERQTCMHDVHKDEFQGICFKNETDALDYINTLPHLGYGQARRREAVSVSTDEYTDGWKAVKVKSGYALGFGNFIELNRGRSGWLQVCHADIHDNLSKFPEAIAFKALREALEANIEALGAEYVDGVLDEVVASGILTKRK